MALSVISAFNEFMTDIVDLDHEVSQTAKKSRDWMVDRIHSFQNNVQNFPGLYSGHDIFFGSFERKTKKRELDDIDLMICLEGDGGIYSESGSTVYIGGFNEGSPLNRLLFDNIGNLNSKRVINKFLASLETVPQYEKAETHLRGEAATLKLKSYPWTFDIVPCFITRNDLFGRSYYLIPDGSGNWKKTDPRIDRGRVERLVALRGTSILGSIRLMKFWNCRATMPTMSSYLLENMILDYYEDYLATKYPDAEFKKLVKHVEYAIFYAVNDPKRIQGDLNTVGTSDRLKISARCLEDYNKAEEASRLELQNDQKASIRKWGDIFGWMFPSYG